jgi:hypothetical protein
MELDVILDGLIHFLEGKSYRQLLSALGAFYGAFFSN